MAVPRLLADGSSRFTTTFAANPTGFRSSRLLAAWQAVLDAPQPEMIEFGRLCASNRIDLNRIAQVIRSDALLTRHLFLWGSELGLVEPDTEASVEEAIVLLGADRLCCLPLRAFLDRFRIGVSRKTLRSIFERGVAAANIAAGMARQMHLPNPRRAFVAGLLHDLGSLPLWLAASGSQGDCLLTNSRVWGRCPETERALFGTDHTELGARLGTVWNLPPEYIEVMALHHRPTRAVVDRELIGVVALATQMDLKRSLSHRARERPSVSSAARPGMPPLPASIPQTMDTGLKSALPWPMRKEIQ